MLYRARISATTHLVRIHAAAHGGAGVGRLAPAGDDQRVWFVDGALPGELVEVLREREHPRWLRGALVRVVEAARERVEPPCALGRSCGGCDWQHVRADAQAPLKLEIAAGQLRHLGLRIDDAVASPRALGYRRRVRAHYMRVDGRLLLGFRRRGSRDLIDVPSCPVLEPALDRGLARLRRVADLLPPSGEVVGLTDGTRVVLGLPGVAPAPALVEALTAALDAELVGVALRGRRQRRDLGRVHLAIDRGGEGRPALEVGPFAFTQAQGQQNAALVDHVAEQAAGVDGGGSPQRILELFAGAGNFTRVLAGRGRSLLAVDDERESIAALEAMVRRAGLEVTVRRATVEHALAKLVAAERRYELVVLDPPRGGLSPAALADLLRVAVGRIIYVSCDAATLARDLARLREGGFVRGSLRVFDMMPMTSAVECVVTLDRAPERAEPPGGGRVGGD